MPKARFAVLVAGIALGMSGCPAPTPQPSPRDAVPTPTAARPVEPTTPTTPTTPPAATGESLPPALAGDGVDPVLVTLWRALEAVDAGDAGAMTSALTDDARWFPPGRDDESVAGDTDLRRAMAPWTSDEVSIDLRRVIEPKDGPSIVQLMVSAGDARHELVLLVEARGDRAARIRHFGDPLGPVRLRPAPVDPLRLGPVGRIERVSEPTSAPAATLVQGLVAAIERRDDEATRAHLAPSVTLHDVRGRKTRYGPNDFVSAYRADLGPSGHLAIAHHYAGSQYGVVEATLRQTPAEGEDSAEREYGLVDIHRFEDGKIAETWHYLNRRPRLGGPDPRRATVATPPPARAHDHHHPR